MVFCELWVGESKGLVFRIFVKSWAKALISGWLEECEAEEAAAAAAAAAEAERQRVRERTQGPADALRFAESLPKFAFFFLRFWQLQL